MRSPIAVGGVLVYVASLAAASVSSAAVPVLAQHQSSNNPVQAIVVPFVHNVACTLWPTRPSCALHLGQYSSYDAVGENGDDENNDDTGSDGDDEETPLDIQQQAARRRHRSGWVYLIRHGEKVKHSDRTGLSLRGIRRTRCLRNVFGRSGHKIDFIMAQDFKPDGRRRRPFETVDPLARALDIPLDHTCDRDDYKCAARKITRHAQRHRQNVLVVWEHARLSDIAERLGVRGLQYPDDRYDVVFKLRNGKVHAIYSEECDGLDEEWFNWHGKKKGRHGKGGENGRLIDDESWAEEVREEPDESRGEA